MPTYYADSSALVKRYLPERGSAWVSSVLRTESVSASALVIPEVASALGRRSRDGELTAVWAREVLRTFLQHVLTYRMYDLTQSVLHGATEILLAGIAGSTLRTLDALHLATVQQSVILSGLDINDLVVLTADRRLMAAASAAGLHVENPEDHA